MAILARSPRRITLTSVLSANFNALTLTFQEVSLLPLRQDLRVGLQALMRGWRPAGLSRNPHPVDRVDSVNPSRSVPARCRPASLIGRRSTRWTFCQDLPANGHCQYLVPLSMNVFTETVMATGNTHSALMIILVLHLLCRLTLPTSRPRWT